MHRSFTFLASKLWNALPPKVRESQDIASFKRSFKANMAWSVGLINSVNRFRFRFCFRHFVDLFIVSTLIVVMYRLPEDLIWFDIRTLYACIFSFFVSFFSWLLTVSNGFRLRESNENKNRFINKRIINKWTRLFHFIIWYRWVRMTA